MTVHVDDCHPAPVAPYSHWRWGVLFSFAISAALNGFMFMNFCTTTSVTQETFSISTAEFNWLYCIALVAVLPATFPAVYFVEAHNFITVLCFVSCNALAAWIRYFSVQNMDYTLAMVGSALMGIAATIMYCAYPVLALRWFPPKEQMLATSIGVMSNYFGWCLGAKITPELIDSGDDGMASLLFYQGILAVCAFVPFFIFHREHREEVWFRWHSQNRKRLDTTMTPPDIKAAVPSDFSSDIVHADKGGKRTVCMELRALATNPAFVVQGSCYAILASISYSIPALQDDIFTKRLNLPSKQNAWANTAFLALGVISGIVFGAIASAKKDLVKPMIGTLYVMCTVSLSALAAITVWCKAGNNDIYIALIVCMALSGCSSLGFFGIALAQAVKIAAPVSEAYSAGLLEWVIQAVSVVLMLSVAGEKAFVAMAVLQGAATLCLLIGFKLESNTSAETVRYNDKHSAETII